MSDSYEETCHSCGGTREQEAWQYDEGKLIKHGQVQCLKQISKEEIWSQLIHLLKQFIVCDIDRDGKLCEGCEVERQEILSLTWHYGHPKEEDNEGSKEENSSD